MWKNWKSTALLAGLFLMGLATCSGCGSSGTEITGPKGTVKGKATLQGKPVPAGYGVGFNHESKQGLIGSAVVTADGSYELIMEGKNQIAVGKYRVTVTAPPEVPLTPEEYEKMMAHPEAAKPKTSSVIPENFSTTFEVKEGANTFDITIP